jgi:ankyrin repeat protein
VIFVDALDEAGEDPARSIVKYLHEANEELLQSRHATSICFACRHYPIVRTHEGLQICVEDENFDDISAYTLSELSRQIHPRDENSGSDPLNEVQELISNKASGVFLWVSLVIPTIAKQYNEGRPLEEILEGLEKAPSDLKTIYEHILGLVDPTFRRQTLHLMEWICLAERPLSLTELRFALAMDDSSINPYQDSAQKSTGFVKSDMQMKGMTVGLSGGLAEVKLHREEHYRMAREVQIVQFIHQSVNDFLLKDGFAWLDQNFTENAIGRGHDRLAKSCINYLKLGEVERVASSSLLKTSSLEADLPFLSYSTASWFLHAQKAESWNILQSDLIQRFQWPTAQCFQNWIKLSKIINKYGSRCPEENTTLMHVAAASNLESIVVALLDSDTSLKAKDAGGNTALHDAARWGHKKIVRMLLDAGADANARTYAQATPLERAGAGGHAEVVKLLLENGADVNLKTGGSGSALQSAAEKGRWVTVKLLLDNGANIHAQGGHYGNVLQAAASNGSGAIVELLLDSGADIHAQGGHYGNVLQAAASNGSGAIVELLLDRGANIHAQGGPYGNALQAAASKGSEAVAKLLLDRGANIYAQGGYYGNALQAAASKGSEAVVELLLDRGADINAQGGYYGNALQAAAYTGNRANVELLLDRGADINKRDPQGRSVVQLAMRGYGASIVDYLLSLGASSDWTYTDMKGCSALHFAASGGSVEAVKFILSSGIDFDINLSDTQGWTPLHWACRKGYVDTAQLLIDSGADLRKENTQLWTPLDIATFCGNDNLISTLSRQQGSTGTEMKQKVLAPGYLHHIRCDSCFLVSAIQLFSYKSTSTHWL